MTTSLRTLIVFVLAIFLLSGCAGLKKMKKNADKIQFKVTPEVLETHAGKVDLAIDGRFPAKYFNKRATLVATPVLKYAGGETAFSPVTVQGEKVQGNNKVISLANGGNFAYKDATNFTDAMRSSDLEIRMTATRKSQTLDFDPVVVGKGVLATSTMVANVPKAILGVRREANNTGKYDPYIDPFQRIVPDEMLADIYYLINRAEVRKEEITSADVQQLLSYTKAANEDDRKDLKGVEVSAYASPDGALDFNTTLAAQRERTSSSFLESELKKAGININLRTRYTPEDWDGFREKLQESNIQDKELILRVLSMYTDPEVREREIRNLSVAFTQLAEDILPQLRRAKLLTSVELIGKTDEEILSLAESNPSALNPAELLYAATLVEDLDRKLRIYNSFQTVYPNDWRGPNNSGYVLVRQMKYADAKPLFEKAERLKTDEPIIKNNLGAAALVEGNIQKAEELFGAASGAGNEVNYNLGIVSLKKADYSRANQYFRNFADPNTALAKILTGDNNGALKDLEGFERPNCFMKEYLIAVVGARTARENLLFDSLKKAVEYNPAMKEKAKTDMEFAKYFDNAQFKAIVQ
jgi:Flp pilus assembly protein TadD